MFILTVSPPRSFGLMLLVGLVFGGAATYWSYSSLDWVYGIAVGPLILSFAIVLGWNTKPMLETEIQTFRKIDLASRKKPEIKPTEKPPPQRVPDKPYEVEDIPGVFTMVELPGGTFEMGSDENDDEKPPHPVTVSDFAISQTPITESLYSLIMDESKDTDFDDEKNALPKNYVSWFGAIDFCNALSERQKLTPAYNKTGETVDWNSEADGYRLPTEAEWEYACRAGTQTRWFFGDDSSDLNEYAWYGKGYGEGPYPVGSKRPNLWGLFDMAGNVWEWCWDWYGQYGNDASENSTDPKSGSDRSLRGGSFSMSAVFLRSAVRLRFRPEFVFRHVGFRCVRAPRRQS